MIIFYQFFYHLLAFDIVLALDIDLEVYTVYNISCSVFKFQRLPI